jgi:hypothetical protein
LNVFFPQKNGLLLLFPQKDKQRSSLKGKAMLLFLSSADFKETMQEFRDG